jgi:hypothetical protein
MNARVEPLPALRSDAETLLQVTDLTGWTIRKNRFRQVFMFLCPIQTDSPTICSDSGTIADSFAIPAINVLERMASSSEVLR